MPPRNMPRQAGASPARGIVDKAGKRSKESIGEATDDGDAREGFAEIYEQNVKDESAEIAPAPGKEPNLPKDAEEATTAQTMTRDTKNNKNKTEAGDKPASQVVGDKTEVNVSLTSVRETAPFLSRGSLGIHPLENDIDNEAKSAEARPAEADPIPEKAGSPKPNPDLAKTLPSFTRRLMRKEATLPKETPAKETSAKGKPIPTGFTRTKSGHLVATQKWEGKIVPPKEKVPTGKDTTNTNQTNSPEETKKSPADHPLGRMQAPKSQHEGELLMQEDSSVDPNDSTGKTVEIPKIPEAAKPVDADKPAPKPIPATTTPTSPDPGKQQEVVTVRRKAKKTRASNDGMPDKISTKATDIMSTVPIERPVLANIVYGSEDSTTSDDMDVEKAKAILDESDDAFPVMSEPADAKADADPANDESKAMDVRITQQIAKDGLESPPPERSSMLYRGESPKPVQRPATPERPADVKVKNLRYEPSKNNADPGTKDENPLQQLERKAMPPQVRRPKQPLPKGIPAKDQGLKPTNLESIEVTSTINLPRGVSALKQRLSSQGRPLGAGGKPQPNLPNVNPELVNEQSAPDAAKAQGTNTPQAVPRMHALQELVRMIQDHVQAANPNAANNSKMVMDFTSNRYGNVSITVQQSSGQLHVVLQAETDSSRQELMDQRNELARQLRLLGYQDVDVEIEGRSDSEKHRQDEEQQQQNREKNVRFLNDEGEELEEA